MRPGLWVSTFLAIAIFFSTAAPADAARFFVDQTLGDVPSDQQTAVSDPRPVQLLFQFTTSSSANARATNALRDQVIELVRQSGLFSEVTTDPSANGAILSVTIDNVGEANAASRGFATGLTFGLVGSTVHDYYVGAVQYVGGPDATPLQAEARHTLITTLGVTAVPDNAVQARNAEEAVRTIVRQLVSHLLNDVAREPSFGGSDATASVAASTAPPVTAAAPTSEPPAAITPAPSN